VQIKKRGVNLKKKSDRVDTLFHKGKVLILAYDQGLEHGPTDFNLLNIDPQYIMDVGLEGRFSAIAAQAGIAEKYHVDHYKDVPLIVKLNGKTKLSKEDPLSLQHTSVDYAEKLGAIAVGYTIYLGSNHEQQMLVEFGKICEEAHQKGLLAICWMYPRGSNIQEEESTETIAYGTRVAMELGADIIKIKYNGDQEGLRWIVKAAGKAKVVIAGGSKKTDYEFMQMTREVIDAGAAGLAVGRNIWQHKNPLLMAKVLKEIIFNNKKPQEILQELKNHKY